MKFRILLVVFISFIAIIGHAADRGWYIKNAEVVSVGSYYDGNHVLMLKFRALPADVSIPVSNCALTWSDGNTTASDVMVVTWWSEDKPHSRVQAQYSTALAAHAQKLPVDIHFETSRCSSTSARPYGNFWTGIRFSE
ncbi:hypothetical protein ACLD02_08360 [Alloalcanivorax sp. C16-2]|uniref:hypothetical protein n=1 Tax=Alloalcanivorax sp. C16-2 TaxID=3390052 RepID=UPI003970BCC6